MMKQICLVILLAVLAGCGGLEISSLSVEEAKNAHKPELSSESESGKKVPGYIVYHPMIVVDVNKECKIGKPQTLPDYGKPFLLKPTWGVGKSSVDLKIEDGWRLAGFKAETDNTAWLKDLLDIIGKKVPPSAKGLQEKQPDDNTCQSGLYKLSIDKDGKKIKFERIEIKVSS